MFFPDLRNKIAIVTGASRRQGIGAAICRALVAQGVHLLFTTWQPFDSSQPHGIDMDGPQALLDELHTAGVQAVHFAVDLSDPAAPQHVLDTIATQLGEPSILVNNAAYSVRTSYDHLTAALLDAHYAVNLRATALLSVGFASRFSSRSGGRIINLTSGQSLGAMPNELAYAATKGAIEALTRTLAVEVADRGITVNAIDPGATDTGWMTDALQHELLSSMRMGRLGQPEDAARLIVFLASEAGAWITGQILHSRGA